MPSMDKLSQSLVHLMVGDGLRQQQQKTQIFLLLCMLYKLLNIIALKMVKNDYDSVCIPIFYCTAEMVCKNINK